MSYIFEVSSLRDKSSTKLPPEKDQSEALRVVRGLSASDLHKSRYELLLKMGPYRALPGNLSGASRIKGEPITAVGNHAGKGGYCL